MTWLVAFIAGSRPERIHRRTVSGWTPKAVAICFVERSFTLTGQMLHRVVLCRKENVEIIPRVNPRRCIGVGVRSAAAAERLRFSPNP